MNNIEVEAVDSVAMPITARPMRKDYDVLLTYGDIHIPHQHEKAGQILLEIMRDIQPDIIVDGGDLICADCLSTYPKDHDDLVGLQGELDEAIKWLDAVRAASPGAKRFILRDNHFWGRLEKKKKGEYWLEGLKCIDADHLLKLSEFGWESMEHYDWKDRITFCHGDDKNGSQDCPVNRSRKMSQNTGKTVVRFHSHVTGMEVRKQAGKEQMAIQMGCMQDVHNTKYVRYANYANWTQSAGLFYLSKETDSFFFVPIFFIDGKAILNGKIYG